MKIELGNSAAGERPELKRRRTSLGLDETRALLLLAVLAGGLLRVLLIGSKSLWLDEGMSLRVTLQGLPALMAGGTEGYHPPLYYAFLGYWVQLGQGEAVLRLSSALFGILAIPLAYALARTLAGVGVGLATAWLVALSPLLVWYGQEFRSYSLLVFLALLAAVALVRMLLRPNAGWFAVYVLASAAAFYTHYNAVLMLPVQFVLVLVLLAQHRLARYGWLWLLAAWPVIVALYWPWLTSEPARSFFEYARQTGAYPGMLLSRMTGISVPLATGVFLVALAVLVAVGVGAWAFIRRRGLWPALYASRALRLGLLLLFAALLVLWVIPRGYSLKRLAVIVWPFACMAVAWFWPVRRPLALPLAVLLGLSLVASLINVTVIPKDQWRETVAQLTAEHREGDAIWLLPGYENVPFDYYNNGRLPVTELNAPVEAASLDETLAGHQRIWLVVHDTDVDFVDPGREVQALLESRLKPVAEFPFHRIHAVLYELP